MKANELRIGNYVNIHDGNIEGYVKTICDIEKYVTVGNNPANKLIHGIVVKLEEIEPIPLTELWLFKFGFLNSQTVDAYSNGVIEISLRYSPTLYDGNFNDDSTKVFNPDIQFVHQLQNLYFALTGKELKLKNGSF